VTRDSISPPARIAIFLVWACVVGLVASRHEPWRDEVRAFSIATSTASLGDLFRELRTDGHPALWHLLLRAVYAVAPVPAVLPAVSLLVAAGAVLLFLARSPFGPVITFLFPFSVFPVYEYSVMARNYGLSILLCFAFAALYRARRRPLLALCLVLLPNSNPHAAFLAAALAFVWCVDEACDVREPLRFPRAVLPVAAAAGGLLFAAWTAFPDADVTTHRGLPSAADSLRAMLADRGGSFLAAPFHAPALLDVAVFLVLAAGFAARPSRLVAAVCATTGFYVFFLAVYPADLRHVGLLLGLFLTLLWIEEDRATPSPPAGPVASGLSRVAFGIVLPAVLAVGVVAGVAKARTDLREDMSASRPLAAFIRAHPDLSDAILIGEPDYALEPVPYYVPNPIYIPREGRYGKWVSFTTTNRDTISLGEILDIAARLHHETNRPVLLLFHPLFVDPGPGDVWKYSYGKRTFTRSPAELERLRRETVPLGRFVDTPQFDERYVVFRLGDPGPPPVSGPPG
jgi:hypothetical protein